MLGLMKDIEDIRSTFLCLWIHTLEVIPSYRIYLNVCGFTALFFLHWNVAPNFSEPLHRVLRCSADWRSNWRAAGRSSWLARDWLATSEATGGTSGGMQMHIRVIWVIIRRADRIYIVSPYHHDMTWYHRSIQGESVPMQPYLTWNHRDSLWANLAEVWLWRHFSSFLWCGRWWWIGG